MRQRDRTASVTRQCDGLGHGQPRRRQVGRAAIANIAGESVAGVARVAGLDQRLCDVWTPHRAPRQRGDLLPPHGHAEPTQQLQHVPHALLAQRRQFVQTRRQRPIRRVNAISEQVQPIPLAPGG